MNGSATIAAASAASYALAGMVALWCAAFAWYGLRKGRGRPFALLALMIALGCFLDAFGFVLPAEASWGPVVFVFVNVAHLAFSTVPVLLYLFARGDSFRGLRHPFPLAAVTATLAGNIVLWASAPAGDYPGGIPPVVRGVFFVQVALNWAACAVSLFVLARSRRSPLDARRANAAMVLVGAFACVVVFGFLDFGSFDLASFDPSSPIMAVAVAFVAVRYRQLDPFTAEAAHEDRLRRFEFMVDASREFMSIINREGRYEAVNKAFCESVGLPREDIVGKSVGELWGAGPAHDKIQAPLSACLAGMPSVSRHRFRFGKEPERALEVSYYPYLPPGADEPTHAVVVTKDITDYVAKEEELEAARAAAVEADKAKGDFLASMSHEIRTPLNAVMGLTDLALRRGPDEGLRDDLETVKSASQQILAIVNDVLDLSKIEAGRVRLERAPFSPAAVVERAAKAFRPAAERKGVALEFRAEEGLPAAVEGDPLRFAQVVYNLIGNAVKFTAEGSVSVSVGAVPAEGGIGVRVAVRDTGIGIAPEKLGGIFDGFSQAEAGTSRRFGGSGLGLSISRKLARLQGGDIAVESENGKGSVFSFTAVLAEASSSMDAAAVEEGTASPGLDAAAAAVLLGASSSVRKREAADVSPASAEEADVLLVEDDDANALVTARFLGALGRSCVRARDAYEALVLLRSLPFRAVLMDVELPGQDGLETTRRIRGGAAGERARSVRVVAMTGHAGADARRRSLDAGMDDHVVKPVDLGELEAALDGPRSREAVAAGEGLRGAVPGEPASPAVLDRREALSRLGGDESLLAELYAIAAEEAPSRIAAAERLFVAADREGLARLAHQAKGTAATIGAPLLLEAAGALEKAAGSCADLPGPALVEAFAEAYRRTAEDLASSLPVSGPSSSARVDKRGSGG